MTERDGARLIGVRAFGDDVLSAVSPLGMALAAAPALVVDLDRWTHPFPGERTLAELVDEGPTLAELDPRESGVAVLPNGGAEPEAALEMVVRLAGSWPVVVARVGAEPVPFPVVPVRPLWPGFLAPAGERASVWQKVPGGGDPPGPGPVLPAPGRSTVSAFLSGRYPLRSRWVRAWRAVWELPWR